MKIPTASSATSSQRGQTSLRSLMPRLPRSNVYSMRDPENPSASVHRKRFLTPSLALKFLCTGELNPRPFESAKSHFFDTSSWGEFCDVTLTLKQGHQPHLSLIHISEPTRP